MDATTTKRGTRKVCVRVVDVFGFKAEVVTSTAAASLQKRLI
ncbi:MAG: hypothetical protein PHR71_04065 [Polaromonas sp.]|nr:hypothetical protein [Polaromonas sp.]